MCRLYFDQMSLSFSSSVNVTTWTVGYAIFYHANLLFTSYEGGGGGGSVSEQAKEAKHSGVKEDWTLTNGQIPHTTNHVLHHTVTNQIFAIVVEIKN